MALDALGGRAEKGAEQPHRQHAHHAQDRDYESRTGELVGVQPDRQHPEEQGDPDHPIVTADFRSH